MSIPHRCPVCEGRGEVGKRLAQVNSVVASKKPLRFKCHCCHGTGMIWEFVLQPFIPNVPYIYQDPPLSNPPRWTVASTADLAPKCDSCQTFISGPAGKDCQNILSHVQSYNIGDHICGSTLNPPQYCAVCFNGRRYDGAKCSCSPGGMPHSENCKGWVFPHAISWEQIKSTAPKAVNGEASS